MVIKIPVIPVSKLTDTEMFDFELSCDQELSRQFVNNLNHRRKAMNQVPQAKGMKDLDIIKYALDFLLTNLKSFHMYEYHDNKTAKFRYKVKKTWMMNKMNKVDLLEKLNKLQNSMVLQMTKPSSIQVDNFFIFHQALLFAGEHEEQFRDFAVLHSSHREDEHHQNGNGNGTAPEDEVTSSQRHCFVCGSLLLPRPYAYFSEAVADKVCQKCVRFAETFSHSPVSSRCQAQGGFCALMDTFEYRGGCLHYRGRDGVRRQYVSNCHVLCRLCRFRRCVLAGLRGDADPSQVVPAPSVPSCVVCHSMKGVSSLGVCSNCQEFLTDSVSESSHSSMTCLHSGTCHVSSSNTATFSACPGCWIARLRSTGVLAAFLKEQGVKKEPEEMAGDAVEIKDELVQAEAHVCVVCDRETTSMYRDKLVCANCKRFVLKCVKTRCYMDFCCAGNSSCALSARSPCSFCWWASCLAQGLVESRPAKRRLE